MGLDWFLLVLMVVLLVPAVVLTTAALVTTTSLRRANRLVPGRAEASAPLSWLWSPGPGALLHRRLRSTCQLVGPLAAPLATKRWRGRRKEPAQVDGIADLARDVLQEAVNLDRQLLISSRLPRGVPRSQAFAALEYQVRRAEDAGRRVHQLATRRAQLARAPMPGALSLEQRISAMEEAFGELAPPPPMT